MHRPRVAAVAVCFCLTLLLTIADTGLAQGYRMRAPGAVPLGRGGAPVGVPKLIGTPPSTMPPAPGFVPPFVPGFGYWYPFGSYGYGYSEYSPYSGDSTAYSAESTSGYSSGMDTQPGSGVYPAADSVPDVGRLHVSMESAGAKTVVRLTWPDEHHVAAAQVAFFLADESRAVLSAQTVRAPPFTALFEPTPETAFTGMTVVLPGGTLVTQFLPYRRRAR